MVPRCGFKVFWGCIPHLQCHSVHDETIDRDGEINSCHVAELVEDIKI